MKTKRRPMTTTILYGLVGGMAFIPAYLAAVYFFGRLTGFNLTISVFLAGYAVLLTRLGGARPGAALFPVLVLLAAALWVDSRNGFLALSLFILSWVRSGVCFQGPVLKKIAGETAATVGGAGLVFYFAPTTPLSWALGVWLFFLVQSLYFVILGDVDEWSPDRAELDRFEKARRRAEAILSERM